MVELWLGWGFDNFCTNFVLVNDSISDGNKQPWGRERNSQWDHICDNFKLETESKHFVKSGVKRRRKQSHGAENHNFYQEHPFAKIVREDRQFGRVNQFANENHPFLRKNYRLGEENRQFHQENHNFLQGNHYGKRYRGGGYPPKAHLPAVQYSIVIKKLCM